MCARSVVPVPEGERVRELLGSCSLVPVPEREPGRERLCSRSVMPVTEGAPVRKQLGSRSVGVGLFLVEVEVPPTRVV